MFRKTVCMLLLTTVFLTLPVAADEGAGERVIYLTFDDGPGPYTGQLLDILQKHGVKATFFLVNTDYRMEELLQRMVSEGHSIGIHSFCHDFKTVYASEAALLADVYAMRQVILKKTGVQTSLLRFPGGSSNTVSRRYCPGIMSRVAEMLEAAGFCYFDWDVDSGDGYGCADPEAIFRRVVAGVKGRRQAVVLQHDVNGCSVQAVERIICWGRANGYTFRPLTQDSRPCHHRLQN